MAEHEQVLTPAARALIDRAKAAERNGQYAAARAAYEDALRTLGTDAHEGQEASDGHSFWSATLLRWIGTTHRDEGHAEAAMDCYQASLAIAEHATDRANMAGVKNCMAVVRQNWGELDLAAELYEQALVLAEDAGEITIAALVDMNMGTVANIRGDLLKALHHYGRSLDRYREVGEDRYLGYVLNNIGMVHTDLRQWEEAEAIFAEAAEVAERLADPAARVMVEVNRTELNILRGDLFRARESCDTAFEFATRFEHQAGLCEVYKNYGIIFREMGKNNLAEAHLTRAAELAERLVNPLLVAEVQREIARVFRSLDRNTEALQALNYSHRVFNELRARLDVADVDRRIGELEEIYLQIVRKWGESIESNDRYTAGHCERVADLSCMLARAVGFDEKTLTWFRMGAFLHDVGKTVVPPEILNKRGKLDEGEWQIMRSHTIVGADLLASIGFPWDVGPMIRSHHERWDGRGYPDGLAGRSIPLSARILCVADVFDALTTTRSYRRSYSVDEALKIMRDDAGTIFDPELFQLFEGLIQERREAGLVTVGG
jgi:putative nucleotidyltransferase with HDIG domain